MIRVTKLLTVCDGREDGYGTSQTCVGRVDNEMLGVVVLKTEYDRNEGRLGVR